VIILDLLGSFRETQCGNGFIKIPIVHSGCNEQDSLRISFERILQQESELTITEVNVLLACTEGVDAVS